MLPDCDIFLPYPIPLSTNQIKIKILKKNNEFIYIAIYVSIGVNET